MALGTVVSMTVNTLGDMSSLSKGLDKAVRTVREFGAKVAASSQEIAWPLVP